MWHRSSVDVSHKVLWVIALHEPKRGLVSGALAEMLRCVLFSLFSNPKHTSKRPTKITSRNSFFKEEVSGGYNALLSNGIFKKTVLIHAVSHHSLINVTCNHLVRLGSPKFIKVLARLREKVLLCTQKSWSWESSVYWGGWWGSIWDWGGSWKNSLMRIDIPVSKGRAFRALSFL